METSALESINVEVAFNGVLAGNSFYPFILFLFHKQSLRSVGTQQAVIALYGVFFYLYFFLWIMLTYFDNTMFFASEIHKKVNNKQVVQTPISGVSINNSTTETTEERRPCCRNIWSLKTLSVTLQDGLLGILQFYQNGIWGHRCSVMLRCNDWFTDVYRLHGSTMYLEKNVSGE